MSREQGIAIRGCSITKTSLAVDPNLSFADWQRIGEALNQAQSAVQFWIGDWLNYGEHKHGEKFAQAIDEKQVKTWQDYAYVASNVQITVRTEKLTWWHHRVIASLSADEQRRWLAKAIEEDMGYRELAIAISRSKLGESTAFPTGKYGVIYADPAVAIREHRI